MEDPETSHELATHWRLEADRHEKRGENLAAAKSYEQAAEALSYEDDEALGYLNQAAINYRLAGDGRLGARYWAKAHELFDRVIADTGNPALRARAQRDKAMLLMEQQCYTEALALLRLARQHYTRARDEVEDAATCGFIGRVEYLDGQNGLLNLMLADKVLRRGDNRVYELNNLVWLMKVVNPIHRQQLLCRALRLAVRTGYRRRAAEALLIAISPRLYDRVLRAKRG